MLYHQNMARVVIVGTLQRTIWGLSDPEFLDGQLSEGVILQHVSGLVRVLLQISRWPLHRTIPSKSGSPWLLSTPGGRASGRKGLINVAEVGVVRGYVCSFACRERDIA